MDECGGKIALKDAILVFDMELDNFCIGTRETIKRQLADNTTYPGSRGAVDEAYRNGSEEFQIVYWIKFFSDCRLFRFFPTREEEKKSKFAANLIKMRTEFEKMFCDELQYLLPRYPFEAIDAETRQYLQDLFMHLRYQGHPWMINSAAYWNNKHKKTNKGKKALALCLQDIGAQKCIDQYDLDILSLRLCDLKYDGKYRDALGIYYSSAMHCIFQLANYSGLLLNHIEKQEQEIESLKEQLNRKGE